MRIVPYATVVVLLLGVPTAGLAAPKETTTAPSDDVDALTPPLTFDAPELFPAEGAPRAAEPLDAPVRSRRAASRSVRDVVHAIVVVEPHVGVGNRSFEYVDRLSPDLRWYDMPAAPRLGISAEAYPLAPFRSDLVSGLGVAAAYATSVFLKSEGAGQSLVDTRWMSFDAALKLRVPIGERSSAAFAKLGYGGVDFDFLQQTDRLQRPTPSAALPAVGYRFVRVGVEGRVAIGRFAVLAGADYLFVTSTGAMGERFPHATVGGVEAQLGGALSLFANVEVRSGLRYQRFFYDLKPETGDGSVAGGALDQLGRWETSVALAY